MVRKIRRRRKTRVPAITGAEKPRDLSKGLRLRDAKIADYKAETFQGYSLDDLKTTLKTEEYFTEQEAAEAYLMNIVKVGIDHLTRQESIGGLKFAADELRWFSNSRQHRNDRVKLLKKLIKEGGG